MIPSNFDALTVPNLNNGTTTIGLYTPPPRFTFAKRLYQTLGSEPFDVRGNLRSKFRFPITYQPAYVFRGATDVLASTHVNTLLLDDIGSKGVFDFVHKPVGTDALRLRTTAVLNNVIVERPHDEMEQNDVKITLVIDILETLTEVTP